jgi:hypothetical protein
MAATMSGVTGGMVVCLGPDGHVAVEFIHHDGHGPAHSGREAGDEQAYESSVDPSCTDIPLFVNGREITRSDRLSHRLMPTANLDGNTVGGSRFDGLTASLFRLDAVSAFQPPLHSLRSIVLLI